MEYFYTGRLHRLWHATNSFRAGESVAQLGVIPFRTGSEPLVAIGPTMHGGCAAFDGALPLFTLNTTGLENICALLPCIGCSDDRGHRPVNYRIRM